MDLVALVREHLEEAHPDVTCSLLETFVEALMGAEVDAICGADYRRVSPERTNRRNGYRSRPSRYQARHHPSSKIPKLRRGSYFPDWLPERRRRSQGGSHQRNRHLLRARGLDTPAREAGLGLGITKLSKSQIFTGWPTASDAKGPEPSATVPWTAVRTRSSPADALVVKVRAASRTVNVHVLVVTGVNALRPPERSSASR